MTDVTPIQEYYNKNAESLAKRFDAQDPAMLYAPLFDVLKEKNRRIISVLEIGAGNGRDVAFFLSKGYSVTATEPAEELFSMLHQRVLNTELLEQMETYRWSHRQFYQSVRINNDSLPKLVKTKQEYTQYDLININAVFQHVPVDSRQEAVQTIQSLMKPDGILHIKARNIPTPEQTDIAWPTPLEELKNSFSEMNLLYAEEQEDYSRTDNLYKFSTCIFAKPV